jgi:DNA primase
VLFVDNALLYPGPELILPGFAIIVVEGEFDCLLMRQELGDLAVVITLGSASRSVTPAILDLLKVGTKLFIATDTDDSGEKAAARWPSSVVRIKPPRGLKDWNEAYRQGLNLRKFWTLYANIASRGFAPSLGL